MSIAPSVRLMLAGACLVLATACDKADFQSSADKAAPPVRIETICDGDRGYTAKGLKLQVAGATDADMYLQGEFCPQAPAELSIVFLVDFSLSMYNEAENRGNDPVIDGSCGRLRAVKAIIKRHGDAVKKLQDLDTVVKVGAVQFASDSVGTLPLTSVEDFEKEATVKNFCRGIDGTNYKAAFDDATKLLKDHGGTKVVYMISDGMPTEGGGGKRGNAPRHRDAAQSAADEFRDKVANVTYNTVFLGNVHEIDDPTLDPEAFLIELTGDKDRVKIVAKADDLAAGILDLEAESVVLALDSKTAVLKVGGTETKLDFVDFAKHPTKDQVWIFQTTPFKAFPGGETSSKLTIGAFDERGNDFRVTFEISPKS